MATLNRVLFEEVIHYLLQTESPMYMAKIHKLLYFLEFNFLERNEEELLKEDFLKNKYGPTSINLAKSLSTLISKGLISVEESEDGKRRYYPIKKKQYDFNQKTQFELDIIIKKYIKMSTHRIAELSHQDIPYKATKDKEIINKQTVFFRDESFSVYKWL